jgi:hypothetical protein
MVSELAPRPAARPREILPVTVNLTPSESKFRNIRQTGLGKEGRILESSHEFSQTLTRVATKLGLVKDYEILAVDSEQEKAACDIVGKVIFAYRGLFERMQESEEFKNKPLTEDHIAAVIAHELAHASVLGDEYIEKISSSFESRLLAFINYPEEFRADREAIKLLEHAGYNPSAMTEMLRSLGMNTNRYAVSHPEIIDRVRKLEVETSQDKEGVLLESEEYTPLPSNLKQWLEGKNYSAETDVYQQTESIIDANLPQLEKMIQNAQTQEAFWESYTAWQHARQLVLGQQFVEQHPREILEYMKNLMILAQLGESIVVDAQGQIRQLSEETDTHRKWYVDFNKTVFPSQTPESLSPVRLFNRERGAIFTVVDSMTYRENLLEHTQKTDIHNGKEERTAMKTAKEKIKVLNTDAQKNLKRLFRQKKNDFFVFLRSTYRDALHLKLPNWIQNLDKKRHQRHSIKAELLDETFFRNAFLLVDQELQSYIYGIRATNAERRGFRAPDKSTRSALDLHDAQIRERLFDQIAIHIAAELMPQGKATQEMQQALTRCIQNDTGMTPEDSQFLASLSLHLPQETFNYGASIALKEFVEKHPVDQLPHLFAQIAKWSPGFIDDWNPRTLAREPLLSPRRDTHSSYRNSREIIPTLGIAQPTIIKQWIGKLEDNDPRDKLFQKITEILLEQPPQNLSLDAAKIVIETNPESSKQIYTRLLRKYVQDLEANNPTDPELISILKNNNSLFGSLLFDIPTLTLFVNKQQIFSANELRIALGKRAVIEDAFDKSMSEVNQSGYTDIEATKATLLQTIDALTVLYKEANEQTTKEQGENPNFTPDKIAALLMHATFEYSIHAESPLNRQEAFIQTVTRLSQKGININPEVLTSKMMTQFLNTALFPEHLHQLRSFFDENPQLPNAEAFHNTLAIFSKLSPNTLSRFTTYFSPRLADYYRMEDNKHKIAELGIVSTNQIFEQTLVKEFLHLQTGPEIVEQQLTWLRDNLSPSYTRDLMILAIARQHLEKLNEQDLFSPIDYEGRTSTNFPYLQYGYERHHHPPVLGPYLGEGFQKSNFPNILKRRYPFLTRADNGEALMGKDDYIPHMKTIGNFRQKREAEKLFQGEKRLFDPEKNFSQRIQELQQISTSPNVVRDIYLEEMISREIEGKTAQQRREILESALPLFTESSTLRTPFAVLFLRDTIHEHPSLFADNDFSTSKAFITTYFPESSFARNYFLDLWENSPATFTPQQLEEIRALRLSPEGKKDETDTDALSLVFKNISEINREEKIGALLWLLDSTTHKKTPLIFEQERKLDGNLDSLPKVFAALTPNEREIVLARFFLGGEGIMDLATANPEFIDKARSQQREFIEALGAQLFADAPSEANLQQLFTTILTESEPAHAANVLITLINHVFEAKHRGETFTAPEIAATTLIEMGVVGKKTAQYISELNWIKQYPDYQKALARAQEDGPVVPRSVLLQFAKEDGLMDASKSFSIVEFGPSAGAASNKQANLVTVVVRDANNELGLPIGKHTLIYKIRRPSAIKINITHDIEVLKKAYDSLPEAKREGKLPPSFADEIEDAALRELDFIAEKEFNGRMIRILEHHYPSHEISAPTIVFASKKGILETRATAQSLRSLYDLQAQNPDSRLEETIRQVEQKVLIEALREVIDGTFHADLQPGNVYVAYDQQSGNIKINFIDWGMREELTPQQKEPTQQLLFALALGNQEQLRKSLEQLEWENAASIEFPPNLASSTNYVENFSQYSLFLLNLARNEQSRLPRHIISILAGLSKLRTYANHVDATQIFSSLIQFTQPKQ